MNSQQLLKYEGKWIISQLIGNHYQQQHKKQQQLDPILNIKEKLKIRTAFGRNAYRIFLNQIYTSAYTKFYTNSAALI